MKKQVLVALVTILVISSASAQDYSKGILVFGSGNIGSGRQYNAAGGIGYQFNKNWTAGGTFSFAHASAMGMPSLYRSYSLGGFLRYTESFGSEHRFFWYLQGNAGYFSSQNGINDPGGYPNAAHNGVGMSIAPGVGINLPRGFALTVTPGSISFMVEDNGAHGSHTGRSASFDASIGRSTFGAVPVLGINKTFRLGHKHTTAPTSTDIAPEQSK